MLHMKRWRDQIQPAPDADTSAWRVLNRPGLWVDNFAGHWLVQTREGAFPEWLREAVPDLAKSLWWKPRDPSARGAPCRMAGEPTDVPFLVTEKGARFRIDFAAGYSPGIFLDQRENRDRVRRRARTGGPVLNTFAYTGAFSIAAALGGAVTTTLDLSATYLEWAKRNFLANELDPEEHFFCKGDTFEWLEAFHRKGRRFRGIVLDPPTFSRMKKGRKTFAVEKDYPALVQLAARLLRDGDAWLLCCANTHRMRTEAFENAVRDGLRAARRKPGDIVSHPMPPEFAGEDYLKTVWVEVAP